MDNEMRELLKYRYERAVETLEVAKALSLQSLTKNLWQQRFFHEQSVEKLACSH